MEGLQIKVLERLEKILEGKTGFKKALAGQYVYGFLVALNDFKVISEEEYREIRDTLVARFGKFA